MEVDNSIFRAYDIRGVYRKNIDEDIMKKIGMAIGTMMMKRNMGNEILIGNDIRESSPQLSNAFIEGATSMGIDVTDVGTVSFGLAIFSGWKLGKSVTAFVTASHNPPEWNGIKFFDNDCVGFFKEDNDELGRIVKGNYFETVKPVEERGCIEKSDLEKDYIEHLKDRFHMDKKIKIVVDCGNGSTSEIASKLFSSFENLDAIMISCNIDPTFPDRGADVEKENLENLIKKVMEERADMGVAFDGDGDRVGFVDNNGGIVAVEQIMSIIGSDILPEGKKNVIANVECSMVLEKTLEKLGGNIIRIPVGHTFMMQSARENDAALGGEPSFHIVIPEYFPFDDAMVPVLKMIEILSKGKERLSDLVKSIPVFPKDRTYVDCNDSIKFKVIENLKLKFADKFKDMNTLDGIRIDLDNGWVLIRASNTSPVIRMTTEAVDEGELKELKNEFLTELKLEIDKVKTME